MEFYLRYGQTFPVPAAVAENLLKIASHDQLKVLLYVLCRAETAVTTDQIVSACNVTPDAVEDALVFWKNVNILRTDEAQPVVVLSRGSSVQQAPLPKVSAPALAPAEPAVPQRKAPVALQVTSSACSMMPGEVAERIAQNQAIAEMFRVVEQQKGTVLSFAEEKSMIWMNEYLGLQPDLIVMLAAFCIEQGVFQVRYMEKIAVEWQERGVMTHELVQEDIRRRTESKSYTGRVMQIFQMTRRPTEKQQAFIDNWRTEGISLELVRIAYEKTRDNKDDKLHFPYLDGILQNWKKAGVSTPEQAEAADIAFRSAKAKAAAAVTAPAESSIDNNELDQLMRQI